MLEEEKSSREFSTKIKTALLSTFNKEGLVEFAKKLDSNGISLIATGGTLAAIENAGLNATPIARVARFPEMLDGRVKTLQPEIFAGILARKPSHDHMTQLSEKGLFTIDMVVGNFYAFEETAEKGKNEEELIEMIDIGGPSIIRAAAKNFESVCVVPSPRFYDAISKELDSTNGRISFKTRKKMAIAAFEMVAKYDIAIYNTLSRKFYPSEAFPGAYLIAADRFESPKYGENPDQSAMIYAVRGSSGGLPEWKQLAGDARSYNNYLDLAAAFEILEGFEGTPAVATVKHGQISGFAISTSLSDAYTLAHACDPEADFGNTTILNRKVDVETARLVGKNEEQDGSVYTEIVLAPGYDPEALEILKRKQKKKIRIIETTKRSTYPFDLKLMQGLALVQKTPDYAKKLASSKLTVESNSKPSKDDVTILLGLWEIARRVVSNGIVIGNGIVSQETGTIEKLWTLGVGTFRKRNGATKIALDNAAERAWGAYCASDGFFPFPDSIDLLAKAGVKAIIQPGGSQSDRRVIETANKNSMVMLFTHERSFKH